MKLPNSEKAEVPEAKIVGYLLSPTHRLGRAKAEFFRRFGFSQDHWRALREALIQHAHESDVFEERQGAFGRGFAVAGPLRCPDGRAPRVVSVWFIETGGDVPKLVTAYAADDRE